MNSLEKNLKDVEIAEGRKVNLTDSYKVLIKKLHEMGPLIVAAEGNPSKSKCQAILAELCDLRLRGIPAFEELIKSIKQEAIVKNFQKRKLRSDEQVEKIKRNFENNISNNKKKNP